MKQTIGNVKAKLSSVEGGTNQHPDTKAELRAALKSKGAKE